MKKNIVIAMLFGALVCTSARAQEQPDLVLAGEITYADYNHYLEVPFTVPPGVTRLAVSFSQDGAEKRTTIDLGLADPKGMRGWSGGNKASFWVAEADATPSYLPGPIEPGEWRLILGVPNIRKGVTSHYRAEIRFAREGDKIPHFTPSVLKPEPGWYRGDLHMHTGHSDGSCLSRGGKKVPCPAFRTVEAAEAAGLDFIAITDHNAATHNDAMAELQPFFDRTLLIPGRELTTFRGHANAFGIDQPMEFRLERDRLADGVHKAGGLISVNHPTVPSGENCMGCGWDAADFDFAKVDAVEVANGGTMRAVGSYDERQGLSYWYELLNRGLSPTAVGGSDNHNPDEGTLGLPTTVVHAASLSERAVLDAIKAGRVFVDLGGPGRRVLDLWAQTPSGRVEMGGHGRLAAGEEAKVTAHLEGVEGQVEIIADGKPLLPVDGDHSFTFTGDGNRHWLHAVVKDAKGAYLLISNPLYFQ